MAAGPSVGCHIGGIQDHVPQYFTRYFQAGGIQKLVGLDVLQYSIKKITGGIVQVFL
jgi:hypothetical protein